MKRHRLKEIFLHGHCRENRWKERISAVTDYGAKISPRCILNLCLISNGKIWWVYIIKSLMMFLLQLYRLGILVSSGSKLSRTPLRAFIHKGQHRKNAGNFPTNVQIVIRCGRSQGVNV